MCTRKLVDKKLQVAVDEVVRSNPTFKHQPPPGKRAPSTMVEGKKLPAVPETLLKRRKQRAEQRAKAKVVKAKLALKAKAKKAEIFKRAERYVREYRNRQRQHLQLKREATRVGNFYVPDEPKLAFVIRIRGVNQMHPRPRKVLQLLRLRQINNGVFVKLNKATLQMLRIVDPYVAWGYPNMKSVHDLIYKRGYAKVNSRRVPITDNSIIESTLGTFVVCPHTARMAYVYIYVPTLSYYRRRVRYVTS
ncbi:unnamed protein product [Toxocara canis]|uniref:60S ribosomal protein L7 n=1 Tax=Toxocara canis TaxID=6265 RepID=A0A183TWF4_TOXCA|nr:unnamed protein product [Toxocara canis]